MGEDTRKVECTLSAADYQTVADICRGDVQGIHAAAAVAYGSGKGSYITLPENKGSVGNIDIVIALDRTEQHLIGMGIRILQYRLIDQGGIPFDLTPILSAILFNPRNTHISTKEIIVYCKTGERSDKVTDELNSLGYEAYSLEGGFKKYQEHIEGLKAIELDVKGQMCPGPIIKIADTINEIQNGQKIYVESDEDAFASDIKIWCERTGNKLESLIIEDNIIKATIIKQNLPEIQKDDDKTFVVFSGDLDKTIAAFIIANGAASMGRNVTMFFTFWGLNILRKPEKVSVKKTLIEKAFGFMMPRGTKKLGLSRMNMAGFGPKMIRSIMDQKGILSLEELIESAKSHGVRIVACQMSMDIMGIHQEELIEGVELGGVATFIGSGEKSDMSLFI